MTEAADECHQLKVIHWNKLFVDSKLKVNENKNGQQAGHRCGALAIQAAWGGYSAGLRFSGWVWVSQLHASERPPPPPPRSPRCVDTRLGRTRGCPDTTGRKLENEKTEAKGHGFESQSRQGFFLMKYSSKTSQLLVSVEYNINVLSGPIVLCGRLFTG